MCSGQLIDDPCEVSRRLQHVEIHASLPVSRRTIRYWLDRHSDALWECSYISGFSYRVCRILRAFFMSLGLTPLQKGVSHITQDGGLPVGLYCGCWTFFAVGQRAYLSTTFFGQRWNVFNVEGKDVKIMYGVWARRTNFAWHLTVTVKYITVRHVWRISKCFRKAWAVKNAAVCTVEHSKTNNVAFYSFQHIKDHLKKK